jgi:hypothetical protein
VRNPLAIPTLEHLLQRLLDDGRETQPTHHRGTYFAVRSDLFVPHEQPARHVRRNDAGVFKWRAVPSDVMQPEAERRSWIGPIDTASRGQLGIVQEDRFLMSVRGAANGPEQGGVIHIGNIICGHACQLRQSRGEETRLHGRFRQSPRSQISHDGQRGEQLAESESTSQRLLIARLVLQIWLPLVHRAA